jgi:ComF family protein
LPICLTTLSRQALDILLPPVCLLCGAPCGGKSGNGALCIGCLTDLPKLHYSCCPTCLAATAEDNFCGNCLKKPPDFVKAHALYRYAFPLDCLIRALKYHAQLALADIWGRQLAHLTADIPFDCVLPLPLHASRAKERGYNQALEIASALAKARHLKLDKHGLVKERSTPPQTGLTLKARLKSPKGAFSCSGDFSGQTVLLVDDVFTTGATVREAARVLKRHGAAAVHVAVVAHAERYQF